MAESPVSTAKTSAVPGATAGTGVSTTPNQSAVPTGAAGTSATPEISGEPDPTNTPVPAKRLHMMGRTYQILRIVMIR